MTWPNDADGDVFRRLESRGFDFSKSHVVDYNVDFEHWPPATAALEILRDRYGNIELVEPDEEGDAYVHFQIFGPVTYEGVTSVQHRVTLDMKPYGGICESWGAGYE
jgi:hypothetical protein